MTDKPREQELLPCPICREQPTDFMEYEDCSGRCVNASYEVRCSNGECYLADGADFHFNSKDEATDAWNAIPRPTDNKTARAEKDRCVAFFCWWFNQPGTNTKQGYDEWLEYLEALDGGDEQ